MSHACWLNDSVLYCHVISTLTWHRSQKDGLGGRWEKSWGHWAAESELHWSRMKWWGHLRGTPPFTCSLGVERPPPPSLEAPLPKQQPPSETFQKWPPCFSLPLNLSLLSLHTSWISRSAENMLEMGGVVAVGDWHTESQLGRGPVIKTLVYLSVLSLLLPLCSADDPCTCLTGGAKECMHIKCLAQRLAHRKTPVNVSCYLDSMLSKNEIEIVKQSGFYFRLSELDAVLVSVSLLVTSLSRAWTSLFLSSVPNV